MGRMVCVHVHTHAYVGVVMGMRSREIYSVIAIGQRDLKYNFLPAALDIQTPRSCKCNEIVPEWATGRFLGCLLLY